MGKPTKKGFKLCSQGTLVVRFVRLVRFGTRCWLTSYAVSFSGSLMHSGRHAISTFVVHVVRGSYSANIGSKLYIFGSFTTTGTHLGSFHHKLAENLYLH